MLRHRTVVFIFCLAWLSAFSSSAQTAPTLAPGPASTPTAAQLEALSGEYTDPVEPDTPLSFYLQDGKLMYETDRRIPTELKAVSATEFAVPDSKIALHFTFDAAGKAATVANSALPDAVFHLTGPAVHHLFHDYQRTEATIPMRDGVKLHAVILKPADLAGPLPFSSSARLTDAAERAAPPSPPADPSWLVPDTSMSAATFAVATKAKASLS